MSGRSQNQRPRNTERTERRLLFFSLEDWNEVWRRNQFVCAELCRRHPDLEILWVCPTVDLLHSIKRREFCEIDLIRSAPHAVPNFEQVKLIKPMKLLPNKVGLRINNAMIKQFVTEALQELQWDEFDTWVNAQQARNYLPTNPGGRVIYDITDDWTKMEQPEHIRQRTIEDDAFMLGNADHVIVCSPQLYENKKSKTKQITLIPNGVDSRRYHPKALALLPVPPDMRTIKHPIVGYTGTLHSSRLDLALIREIALKMHDVNFVFVGPNSLTPTEELVLEIPNVHIMGARSYAKLPSYIRCFDACMTPHSVNEFTESLDPLKLYEYMSTGLPIVSTDCAGFRDVKELIRIASDPDSFESAIRLSLNTDNSQVLRLAWASERSWSRRVDEIDKILGWN